MLVKELIEKLQDLRQDSEVWLTVDGHGSRIVDVTDDDHEDLEGNYSHSACTLWDKPHEEYDLTEEQMESFGLNERIAEIEERQAEEAEDEEGDEREDTGD